MGKVSITQRELRNESGKIMRALDRGRSFVVTRNGVPVGELRPVAAQRFVAVSVVREAFAAAPRIDRARFRKDVDLAIDQDARPAWPLYTCNFRGLTDLIDVVGV